MLPGCFAHFKDNRFNNLSHLKLIRDYELYISPTEIVKKDLIFSMTPENSSRPFQNWLSTPGVHSHEMPGTEVPLGWVTIFELRYRDGS